MIEKTLSYKIAKTFSTLFVPPTFTILIFTYLAFTLNISNVNRVIVLITVYSFGFAIPIIVYFYLRKKGKINDYDLSDNSERILPYTIQLILYVLGLLILLYFKIEPIITILWSCYITTKLIEIIVNKKWKLSSHSLGAAQHYAFLIFINSTVSILFLPIVLIIGWARLKLNCHNFMQIFVGLIIGFSVTLLQIILLINL